MHAMLIDFTFFAYTVELANALTELCEVTVMLPDRAPAYCAEAIKESVDLHRFHMPRRRHPTNVFMVYSLFRAIRRIRPDVVHQLAWHPWMTLALPAFPRVPLVTTIHDARRHPGDRESFALCQERNWRRSEQVIAHADSVKQQVVEEYHLPEDKVQVVPIGPYSVYRTWISDEVSEKPGTILFFGRIWGYKGLQHLIQAEPLITQQVPDARIVIAGHGEPFEKYERQMVNRDRFVVHNHYIPDDMVTRLFQEASVVALPYVEASQSAVLSIAYALGKPVVATAVGGIPEVLDHGETGYLVPPSDPPALADAIVKLLQDHALRRKMGRRALEKAETELSWSTAARKTLQVYRRASAAAP
jgi:glycosyltransferase involved in cell wall biosynthesis